MTGIQRRHTPAAELHRHIVTYGAQGHSIFRNLSVFGQPEMSNQAITRRHLIAGFSPNPVGITLFAPIAPATSAVLPGVQRTDCLSPAVQIEDSMLLSGDADA